MPGKAEYWRDPEKHRAKTKAYNEAHPDWHRESNKLWARKKRASMGLSARQQKGLREKKADPVGYLLHHAKARARQKGLPFDLDRDSLVIPEVCPVFGVPFEWGVGVHGWRNMWAPSLDRIKPQLGYVRGNVLVISNRANHLKSNGSIAEIEAVLSYMKRVGANPTLEDQQKAIVAGFGDILSNPQLAMLL